LSSSGLDGLLQSSAIKEFFGFDISKERNMFVAIEKFIAWLIKSYDKHPSVSTDGGTWYSSQACKFLKLPHQVHFLYTSLRKD
jgi:transposase-like protein